MTTAFQLPVINVKDYRGTLGHGSLVHEKVEDVQRHEKNRDCLRTESKNQYSDDTTRPKMINTP